MFSRSLDTLTDERVNFYPVFMEEDELSEIPIEEESFIHCDCCPLCEEQYNIEMTDDGWQCGECEHVWTDTNDGLGDDELRPPQESYRPSDQTIAANRADVFNPRVAPTPEPDDFDDIPF
jgi:hypothetical protein